MKKFSILLLSIILFLTGCGTRESDEKKIIDLTPTDTEINYQTSGYGVAANDKNLTDKLVSGRYYVLHKGVYYPLFYSELNFSKAPNGYKVDSSRHAYFTVQDEIHIPTLFEGDTIVYYSTDGLLDYMLWERYYDMGYTVGLFNLQEMTSGRIYLDLSDDKTMSVMPGSELEALLNLKVESLLIDRLGGTQVTKDLIKDGLISNTKKMGTYDLDVYTGTQYKHYTAVANVRAMKAYELYASIEYTPLQQYFYEIEVPEYFLDGYYLLNGAGFVRIVRGDSYSVYGDFNKQLLYVTADEYGSPSYMAPGQYSTYDPLNEFSTKVEGAFGYIEEETRNEEKAEEILLTEAVKKEFELFFPKDRKCKIQIESNEKTGEMILEINGKKQNFTYDGFNNIYEIGVQGNDAKGLLTVTGLTKSYSIKLINAKLYDGQLDHLDVPSEDTASETQENGRRNR